MLNVKEIKEYIEKKNNVNLTPMQYQILKAIVRGDVIYTARRAGRSLLYKGYADYLVNVISKDTDRTMLPEDFDSIFTGTMLANDIFKITRVNEAFDDPKQIKENLFLKEFECEFECI